MQLPKYRKKKRIKLKVCVETGCGKEFWGHPIAKYCETHRDIKARVKVKKEEVLAEDKNITFKHNYTDAVQLRFICCLEGCQNQYLISIHPKQYIYPRFCFEHRNDYRREHFHAMYMKKKAMESKTSIVTGIQKKKTLNVLN